MLFRYTYILSFLLGIILEPVTEQVNSVAHLKHYTALIKSYDYRTINSFNWAPIVKLSK